MADPVITDYINEQDRSVRQVVWTLTTADPTGVAVEMPEWSDKTWSTTVTALGASVAAAQGAPTNVDANFGALNGVANGLALTFNSVSPQNKAQVENPRYVRPKLTTVGVGADVTVTLLAVRATRLRA